MWHVMDCERSQGVRHGRVLWSSIDRPCGCRFGARHDVAERRTMIGANLRMCPLQHRATQSGKSAGSKQHNVIISVSMVKSRLVIKAPRGSSVPLSCTLSEDATNPTAAPDSLWWSRCWSCRYLDEDREAVTSCKSESLLVSSCHIDRKPFICTVLCFGSGVKGTSIKKSRSWAECDRKADLGHFRAISISLRAKEGGKEAAFWISEFSNCNTM